MRVLVHEHLCGGATGAESLAVEGWAMLSAVVADLAACPSVTVCTLLAEPWLSRAGAVARAEVHSCHPGDEDECFRCLAATAEYCLIVAPESEGVLARRCRVAVEAGSRLLGSTPEAIELTADKLLLAETWRRAEVPTVPTIAWSAASPVVQWPLPWVCKPRDGAGSQATFRIDQADDLCLARDQAQAEGWMGELVVQPMARGKAASVTCLVGPSGRLPLPAAEQLLSEDGRFRYLGGRLPLAPDLATRAQMLAEKAVAAVPGLRGWVGVDLVLGPDTDGSGDVAIEINPRLTTSYTGLRRLAQGNLAAALLAVVEDAELSPLNWRDEVLWFATDGRVGPAREARPVEL